MENSKKDELRISASQSTQRLNLSTIFELKDGMTEW